MINAILALSSCIHDEVYSSADPASTEYTNKTLWEQDEKYIKNVMTVYLENEKDIRKSNGMPFWSYATTINTFDESFLMVPVVENKRVVSVLQVPRKGSKIHFYYSKINEQINFFQGLIFAKHKKAIFSENADTNKAIICTTQIMAVWLPNDESDPDPESGNGVWSPRSIIVCKEYLESCVSIINEFGECDGGGDGDDDDDPGYDYPGEEEEPTQLPNPKDPCAKTKTLLEDPVVTEKVGTLKEQSKIKKGQPGYGEKAFEINNDGTSSGMIDGEEHLVRVGSTVGKQGVYHNHTPDGIKMPSPPDIIKMLHYALSQPNGNISNGFLGMAGSEVCSTCPGGYKYHNYIIRFSGTLQELGKLVNQTNWNYDALNEYFGDREWEMRDNPLYTNEYGKLNSNGLQKLFFDTLKNMGVEGKINLQRVEDNGSVQNIVLDNTGNPTPIPCP